MSRELLGAVPWSVVNEPLTYENHRSNKGSSRSTSYASACEEGKWSTVTSYNAVRDQVIFATSLVRRRAGSTTVSVGALASTHHVLSLVTKETVFINASP